MNTPSNTSSGSAPDLVHLPHSALNAYYAEGDAQARQAFLRQTFDATAPDYDQLEKILGLGTGSWYRRQALQRSGLQPGMDVVDVGMARGSLERPAASSSRSAPLALSK